MDICEMQFDLDTSASVLEEIKDDFLSQRNIRLLIKRDDLIDSDISGNKWRKLKFNVLQCLQQKNTGILTFGGAFSNHLVATAAACQRAGLDSVGIVRGDELNAESNATLKKCAELGMQMHFVSREEYGLKSERFYHEELLDLFPNKWIVPEGGANYQGVIGCQEMVKEIKLDFDRIVVAQGTTSTSCGILLSAHSNQRVSVVPAMKGFQSIEEMQRLLMRFGLDSEMVAEYLGQVESWGAYHCGGYAKVNDELISFLRMFYAKFHLKLDPIYTGKAMFALWKEIEKQDLKNETIVFVHTGGLQGIAGIEERIGEKLFQETN